MDLSIIIVAFRDKEKLRTTLEAVFNSKTNFSYEVIVVDNDPKSGSSEMIRQEFPQTKVIENSNEGFAKGNNRGIRVATGKYILLLNPDTAVQENTLNEALKYLQEHADIGALGIKLIFENGKLDKACRRSFPNPINSFFRLSGLALLFPKSKSLAKYNLTFLPEDQATDVDALSGAFMLMPRAVLDKVGLLDEDFFMYGEDIELCYRIKTAGYRVYYYPKVFTYHYKGQSSRKTPYISLYWFHNAMVLFYRKHYAKKYFFPFNWLVYAGIWARFYALLAKNYFKTDKFVSKNT